MKVDQKELEVLLGLLQHLRVRAGEECRVVRAEHRVEVVDEVLDVDARVERRRRRPKLDPPVSVRLAEPEPEDRRDELENSGEGLEREADRPPDRPRQQTEGPAENSGRCDLNRRACSDLSILVRSGHRSDNFWRFWMRIKRSESRGRLLVLARLREVELLPGGGLQVPVVALE